MLMFTFLCISLFQGGEAVFEEFDEDEVEDGDELGPSREPSRCVVLLIENCDAWKCLVPWIPLEFLVC